jgi:hypothetical protein
MAIRARGAAAEPPASKPAAEPALDEIVAVLIRLTASLIVYLSSTPALMGQGATFRSIVTHELRLADDADVDVIEAWLTSHQGG